jgi:phenylacetic acid degradation operon negative regulatory protein
VFYQLTPKAQHLLVEGDERIFHFGRTPGDTRRWTVLWHSLPEQSRTERASLATRLRFLGFGSVQDATWIAPHDREKEVIAVLGDLGVSDYAYVLVGEPAAALNVETVIDQAWNLEEVTRQYAQFVDDFSELRTKRSRANLSDVEAFVVRTQAIHRFRRFPFLDPELPDDVMPDPRVRPRVIKLFDVIFEDLRDAAERHFRETIRA